MDTVHRSADNRGSEQEKRASEQIGYDLSRFDNSETVRNVRTQEAGAVPGSKRRVKPKFHLSFMTAVFCLAATAVAGLLLMSYLNLTVINDEIAKLQDEIVSLRNENVLLQTEYESRYDLNEVEEYAVKNLGMIKLERSQVEYVEIASPDTIRAVNPSENNASARLTDGFGKFFSAIFNVFRGSGE